MAWAIPSTKIRKGRLDLEETYPVINSPPDPLKRTVIKKPLSVGVRCIDGVLTCGKGQRIGIFAAAGVGKSTLLGMIARNAQADVNVISLIGERGREVREFIENDLGEKGMQALCRHRLHLRPSRPDCASTPPMSAPRSPNISATRAKPSS